MASVDLCAVAAGRLDGYYERGLNYWDYAAGALIAAEAGAVVGDSRAARLALDDRRGGPRTVRPAARRASRTGRGARWMTQAP